MQIDSYDLLGLICPSEDALKQRIYGKIDINFSFFPKIYIIMINKYMVTI